MISLWIALTTYYALSFPEFYDEVITRKKYAIEIILQDEGFFDENILLKSSIKKIKQLYSIADKGAEYIAWLSVLLEKKNWREFIFKNIYSKNGLYKRMNDIAKNYKKQEAL